jgi:D-alanyl-lipoteichoic acid acyltransferase DltB (MBOAT superfamily)
VREQSVPLNTKQRCATAHRLDSYNLLNYFAYVVYPPLYIAGPIMTFNDFYWQVILGRWLLRAA